MIITTTETVAGREIARTLGVVTGATVRARHIGSDMLAALKNVVGGELGGYSKLLAGARDEALRRLAEAAAEKGADAVVGVRLATSTIAPSAAEVLAYGTAVKLR
ncbi:MAG: UPF0145 protein [Rhodothalassiaceae bacterium]|nr:MAG: UPF0145 protein [Rhodothalassiaceae bacterium]